MFKILSLLAVVIPLLPANGLSVTPQESTSRFNRIIEENFAANFEIRTEYENFGLSVKWEAKLPEEYDYHVSIEKNGLALCSAAVVEESGVQMLVTAARCVEGENAADLTIRYNTAERESGGKIVRVRDVYNPYGFGRTDPRTQIAVVYPNSKIDIKSSIRLPSMRDNLEDAVVTGWPTLYPAEDHKNLLLYTKVPIVSESECGTNYGFVCAGVRSNATSYCYVTTGSPLVAKKKGESQKVLAGFLMADKGCRREITPTPFFGLTRIENYKDSMVQRGK